MEQNTPEITHYRVAELSGRLPTPFKLCPDADSCTQIATTLGILGVRKLRFSGSLSPKGTSDWQLKATLGVTITQACTITLEPVTTRIDMPIKRQFVAEIPDTADLMEEETEMPEDDTVESLGDIIDIQQTMIEVLSLALPDYPRKELAELRSSQFSEPGITPMTDQDTRPFAGLAGLKNKLNNTD